MRSAHALLPLFVLASACGDRTAIDFDSSGDAAVGGASACAPHTNTMGRQCEATDVLACGKIRYQVSCECPSEKCVCAKDVLLSDGTTQSNTNQLHFPGVCSSCNGDLRGVYAACGFPF